MTFLYAFVLFFFIPLYFFYKKDKNYTNKYKKRERYLLFLSLSFALLALSRPVILNKINKQKFDAQDFIVAIDASYSMQAKDLKPTRYDVAKRTLKELLALSPKDRFSIFAFTSNTILISPPTTDTAISLMALDSLEPKYILTKGTSLTQLLKTVSKSSFRKKNLIIFSDGGEDHDLHNLLAIAKKSHIIPFVVATGSKDGAILSKDDKNIKDNKNNLVISRINPILKDFALLSGGKYYELLSAENSIADALASGINSSEQKKHKLDVDVLSFTELFYYPLILSIIFFIAAVTKIHQFYIFIPLLFFPHEAESALLDFLHVNKATSAYNRGDFNTSIVEFGKITPSVQSYYNRALSYYKAGEYRDAVEIFTTIKTTDSKIKQDIFYNLGNCAVKLGKYDRAKIYYKKALNLGEDDDSYANLMLLFELKLKEKRDLSNMLRKNEVKKQTGASKKKNLKKEQQKNAKNSSSKSKQKAGESSNGASDSKEKQKKQALQNSKKTINSKYKIGYKAYELINKGYTNEQRPW